MVVPFSSEPYPPWIIHTVTCCWAALTFSVQEETLDSAGAAGGPPFCTVGLAVVSVRSSGPVIGVHDTTAAVDGEADWVLGLPLGLKLGCRTLAGSRPEVAGEGGQLWRIRCVMDWSGVLNSERNGGRANKGPGVRSDVLPRTLACGLRPRIRESAAPPKNLAAFACPR
jgi:hypothetical protein